MIDAETANAGTVSEAAIRQALTDYLQSQTFRRSPKLAAFLSFIVEEELAGRGDAIKAYTIATRALNRSPSFDPANDPSVRVEAGRLRRALEEAQNQEGAAWPVRIVVPVGGYRPIFEPRSGTAAPERPEPVPVRPETASPPEPTPEPAPIFDTRGQAIIAGLLTAILLLLAVQVGLKLHGLYGSATRPVPADDGRHR
ncbi:hypothetical protein [Methylobacterium sp. ID0610]|uniref:hypothetical protein n=1 Tax=Methylobacterium carpenticola TaxID=3344827 RepID=UPI00368A53CA